MGLWDNVAGKAIASMATHLVISVTVGTCSTLWIFSPMLGGGASPLKMAVRVGKYLGFEKSESALSSTIEWFAGPHRAALFVASAIAAGILFNIANTVQLGPTIGWIFFLAAAQGLGTTRAVVICFSITFVSVALVLLAHRDEFGSGTGSTAGQVVVRNLGTTLMQAVYPLVLILSWGSAAYKGSGYHADKQDNA